MEKIGPSIEILTHRLAETPLEFLEEPRIDNVGTVHVAALVNDMLNLHGARALLSTLERFQGSTINADRNRLALVMIAVWLLSDDWFISARIEKRELIKVLDLAVTELATTTPAHKFINDPDRREELVRVVLERLNYRPLDETQIQATDRLSSISGIERKRLLEASRVAEERARSIRDALAKKAAEESADKWSRE